MTNINLRLDDGTDVDFILEHEPCVGAIIRSNQGVFKVTSVIHYADSGNDTAMVHYLGVRHTDA